MAVIDETWELRSVPELLRENDRLRKNVPRCVLQTETYRRFLKTGEPEVTDEVRCRRDVLVSTQLAHRALTPAEVEELSRLEAELDASDYAAQPPDRSWVEAQDAKRGAQQREHDRIAQTLISDLRRENVRLERELAEARDG